jgi:hypothetical protein
LWDVESTVLKIRGQRLRNTESEHGRHTKRESALLLQQKPPGEDYIDKSEKKSMHYFVQGDQYLLCWSGTDRETKGPKTGKDGLKTWRWTSCLENYYRRISQCRYIKSVEQLSESFVISVPEYSAYCEHPTFLLYQMSMAGELECVNKY